MNVDVNEFQETQDKVIQLEKENQKLKAFFTNNRGNMEAAMRDKQQISAKLRENVAKMKELEELNSNLKSECDQISQDKQKISADLRENVARMRELEKVNFNLKSECDQYLEFSEAAREDQEISDENLKLKENFIKDLEKRLEEKEENPDCTSKRCENDKNDKNDRIADGTYILIQYKEIFINVGKGPEGHTLREGAVPLVSEAYSVPPASSA